MIGGIGSFGSCDSASIARMRQNFFSKLDTDSSGSIDKTEIGAMVKEGGASADEIFGNMDTDEDGLVSQAEFEADTAKFEEQMRTAFMSGAGGSQRTSSSVIGQNLDSLFNAIDTSGDGSIDETELLSILDTSEEDSGSIFSDFDTDGDGVIGKAEFGIQMNGEAAESASGSLLSAASERGQGAESLFGSLDTNGDGVIDISELEAGQPEYGPSARDMLSMMDTNEDGSISEEEFDAAAPPPPPPSMPSADETESAASLFGSIDTNGDGSIDADELNVFTSAYLNEVISASGETETAATETEAASEETENPVSSVATETEAESNETESTGNVFSSIDTDGDGVIDADELNVFTSSYLSDASSIFDEIDLDRDGAISRDESKVALGRMKLEMQETLFDLTKSGDDRKTSSNFLNTILKTYSGADSDGTLSTTAGSISLYI